VRLLARRLENGDGDLGTFGPRLQQDLCVVAERLVDGVEQAIRFLDPGEPEARALARRFYDERVA
jgi:hypothetical protein